MPGQVVFLLRHGRTRFNADGRLRGRADISLDETGWAEAAALGALFAEVPFGGVLASPLVRALDTARAVAGTHGLTVTPDAALADRDWGPWTGWAEAAVIARFGDLDNAPGVESRTVFQRRAVQALEHLAEQATEQPVVAVAHDAVNRAALAGLVAATGDERNIPQPTGCWNQLIRLDDRWDAPVIGAVPGDGLRPGV